jgi:hypothetical protein
VRKLYRVTLTLSSDEQLVTQAWAESAPRAIGRTLVLLVDQIPADVRIVDARAVLASGRVAVR